MDSEREYHSRGASKLPVPTGLREAAVEPGIWLTYVDTPLAELDWSSLREWVYAYAAAWKHHEELSGWALQTIQTEDVADHSLALLVERIGCGEQIESPLHWLKATIRNTIKWRAMNEGFTDELAEDAPAPALYAADYELDARELEPTRERNWQRWDAAISSLQPQDQILVSLHAEFRTPFSEIAITLGLCKQNSNEAEKNTAAARLRKRYERAMPRLRLAFLQALLSNPD